MQCSSAGLIITTVKTQINPSHQGGRGLDCPARGSAVPMQSLNGVGGQWERDFALLINSTRQDKRLQWERDFAQVGQRY